MQLLLPLPLMLAAAAAAAVSVSVTPAAVHAVLSVSVAPGPPLVCISGAAGCRPTLSTEAPLETETSKPKVFFVDEDSAEAVEGKRAKKKKKTPDVPVVVGFAGWEGKDLDDLPIRGYDPGLSFDREHSYSYNSPTFFYKRPKPRYGTDLRSSWLPAAARTDSLATDSTIVVRQLISPSSLVKALYPQRQSGWGWRPVVPLPPPPSGSVPGFYGGLQPRVYPSGGGAPPWCRPVAAATAAPAAPTSTAPPAPPGVKDRLDLEDSGEGGGGGEGGDGGEDGPGHWDRPQHSEDGRIKVDGKIDLEDER